MQRLGSKAQILASPPGPAAPHPTAVPDTPRASPPLPIFPRICSGPASCQNSRSSCCRSSEQLWHQPARHKSPSGLVRSRRPPGAWSWVPSLPCSASPPLPCPMSPFLPCSAPSSLSRPTSPSLGHPCSFFASLRLLLKGLRRVMGWGGHVGGTLHPQCIPVCPTPRSPNSHLWKNLRDVPMSRRALHLTPTLEQRLRGAWLGSHRGRPHKSLSLPERRCRWMEQPLRISRDGSWRRMETGNKKEKQQDLGQLRAASPPVPPLLSGK